MEILFAVVLGVVAGCVVTVLVVRANGGRLSADGPGSGSSSPRTDAGDAEGRNAALARAAHDLRVPLSSLAGTAETLHQHIDALSRQQRDELLATLLRSTRRVSAWVEALLEDTVAEGAIEADPAAVRLDALLEEAREAAQAATTGMDVTVAPTRLQVWADPRLVVRALSNLLANAGHHAIDGGRVEVRAHRLLDSVEVAVVDHGPGFRGSDQARDAGSRGAPSDGHAAGLGLGLDSVRRLVSSWDGEIGVRETPGGGATVWFTLEPAQILVLEPPQAPARSARSA